MKSTAYMITASAALMLLAMVPAYAHPTSATVNIPFAFTVDDVLMPAGEYVITTPSERVIRFQRVGGAEVETAVINSNEGLKGNGAPEVIFRRYGDQYFAATVYLPNADHSHEFVASAVEIQVARNTKQQTYELAMNVKK